MQNINYNLEVDGNHAIPTDAYKAPVFLVKLIDLKVTFNGTRGWIQTNISQIWSLVVYHLTYSGT